MKKHVVMVAAAVLLGTVSFAQTAGPRGGAPGGQAGKGAKAGQRGQGGQLEQKVFGQLGLSAAQKQKIEALRKSRMDQFKAMREKAKASGQQPDRKAMAGTFKKMQEEYQASLKNILTPAQFTKFQSLMKAEMEKYRKEHPGGPAAGAKGGKGLKGGGF